MANDHHRIARRDQSQDRNQCPQRDSIHDWSICQSVFVELVGPGLTLDLTGRGMGLRSNRYSMLVKDGKVASLNVEAPGKFEVSNAETLLAQAKG